LFTAFTDHRVTTVSISTLTDDDAAALTRAAAVPAPLPEHLPALDGIRGIAITLVFVHTLNVVQPGGALESGLAWLGRLGWIGVELFFVLSGFLITRNLLALKASPDYFRVFWGRRVLRIFPLYFTTLAMFFIVWPLVGHPWPQYAADVPHQWVYWLFLSNWTQALGMGNSLPHFWSLAVEEQFYLVWPFVVWWAGPRRILLVCCGVAVATVLSRVALLWQGADPMQIYTFTITRMDALAAGAAVAAWLQLPGSVAQVQSRRVRWVLAVFTVLAIGKLIPHGYGMVDWSGQVIGYSLLAIVFALWVTVAACGDAGPTLNRAQRVLHWKPLRTLGKYSFGMYVFHAPLRSLVGEPLLEHLGWRAHPTLWQGLGYLVLMAAIDFTLAWLSFNLLEKRFLGLKRFFVPRVSPQATANRVR
jgi:peptidoglycan/LPS O-acetylase OafA/YrhL